MGVYIPSGKKIAVSVKLTVPDDFHWKVFDRLIQDLGVQGELIKKLRGAVRRRSIVDLFELLPMFEPRSILKQTDDSYLPVSQRAMRFFGLYQLGAFLKKYPFKGQDTKTPALEKFFQAESQCKLFNKENYKALMALSEKHPDFLGILEELRQDIADCLGEQPDIDSIIGHAKHGPGVSLGDSYKDGRSTSFYKWSNLPYSVTQGTYDLARHTISTDPRWIGALDDWYRTKNRVPVGQPIDVEAFWAEILVVVDGSRITNVPKTALTDRTIAIEPLLNVYLQLGVDHVIKSALRRKWGYDLTSQERNQKMALEGSETDTLVTVDLKGASDTVALQLCYLLLPALWYDLLVDLRSPEGVVDGIKVPFEKISSMGNGYTFALESLIFGAIVRCAIRRTKSVKRSAVYGDDLIVPTTAYPTLLTLLNLCGFRINEDKTFTEGPFRESCGKDFYSGYDVRPLFLKKRVSTIPDLLYLRNSFWSLEKRLYWAWGVEFSKTLAYLNSFIPRQVAELCCGPASETLDAYVFDEKPIPRRLDGERCFWQLIAKPVIHRTPGKTFLFRKLMNQLRPRPTPREWWMVDNRKLEYKWERERQRFDTGNAFDVTRRDDVVYYIIPHYPVSIGECDRKPLPNYLTRKSQA